LKDEKAVFDFPEYTDTIKSLEEYHLHSNHNHLSILTKHSNFDLINLMLSNAMEAFFSVNEHRPNSYE